MFRVIFVSARSGTRRSTRQVIPPQSTACPQRARPPDSAGRRHPSSIGRYGKLVAKRGTSGVASALRLAHDHEVLAVVERGHDEAGAIPLPAIVVLCNQLR